MTSIHLTTTLIPQPRTRSNRVWRGFKRHPYFYIGLAGWSVMLAYGAVYGLSGAWRMPT